MVCLRQRIGHDIAATDIKHMSKLKTSVYRTQHSELARLAACIPAEGAMPNAFEASLALARLKGVLGVHLKLEDDVLYPAMLAHESAEVREKAAKYQREMGTLAAAFTQFYQKWASNSAIEANPSGFQREWAGILKALQKRIEAEESDLYAAVDAYVDLVFAGQR